METVTFAETVRTALIAELEEFAAEVRKIAEKLNDSQLWKKPVPDSNSVGHLMLHLTGNINHFVGAELGKTGYVRQREREFTENEPPPREQLLRQFDAAIAIFHRVVESLTESQLAAPHERFGNVTKTLIHLVAHFALHRGQMSYISRLVA